MILATRPLVARGPLIFKILSFGSVLCRHKCVKVLLLTGAFDYLPLYIPVPLFWLEVTQRLSFPASSSIDPLGSPRKDCSHEPLFPNLLKCSSTGISCNYSVAPELQGEESQSAFLTSSYCLRSLLFNSVLDSSGSAYPDDRYDVEEVVTHLKAKTPRRLVMPCLSGLPFW